MCISSILIYGVRLQSGTMLVIERRVTKETQKSHICCLSYRLNLGVKNILEKHADFENIVAVLYDVMREIKWQMKSAAYFRNIAEFKSVSGSKTC